MNVPRTGDWVFDSFALLAYLGGEASAGRVEAILHRAKAAEFQVWMSVVNLGEVLYITERRRGLAATRRALAAVEQLPLAMVVADRAHALAAAHIKAIYPLSYADAFAIALAQLKGARLLTGDPEFRQVATLVPIEWIAR